MRHYPIMLDLRGRRCLLVGAGEVGRRKLATLLECSPTEVRVLDPLPTAECLADFLHGCPAGSVLEHLQRPFEPEDLDGRFLVIAATADAQLNAHIGELCRERNLLCNVITQPEAGSFIVPSQVRLDDLTVALSTGGNSPALARVLRRDLQEYLASRYDGLLRLMGRLRPMVLALDQPQAENARLFRSLVESPLAGMLASGQRKDATRLLAELLPAVLHDRMEELLDGLV